MAPIEAKEASLIEGMDVLESAENVDKRKSVPHVTFGILRRKYADLMIVTAVAAAPRHAVYNYCTQLFLILSIVIKANLKTFSALCSDCVNTQYQDQPRDEFYWIIPTTTGNNNT